MLCLLGAAGYRFTVRAQRQREGARCASRDDLRRSPARIGLEGPYSSRLELQWITLGERAEGLVESELRDPSKRRYDEDPGRRVIGFVGHG
jgi:hypothetical protein